MNAEHCGASMGEVATCRVVQYSGSFVLAYSPPPLLVSLKCGLTVELFDGGDGMEHDNKCSVA